MCVYNIDLKKYCGCRCSVVEMQRGGGNGQYYSGFGCLIRRKKADSKGHQGVQQLARTLTAFDLIAIGTLSPSLPLSVSLPPSPSLSLSLSSLFLSLRLHPSLSRSLSLPSPSINFKIRHLTFRIQSCSCCTILYAYFVFFCGPCY